MRIELHCIGLLAALTLVLGCGSPEAKTSTDPTPAATATDQDRSLPQPGEAQHEPDPSAVVNDAHPQPAGDNLPDENALPRETQIIEPAATGDGNWPAKSTVLKSLGRALGKGVAETAKEQAAQP